MEFEYDPNKSASNAQKHGIDFEQAQLLWADPLWVEVAGAYEGEPRYGASGMIAGKCWTAIVTYRGEATRIISVRRSRKSEEKIYYGEAN